MKIKNIFSVIGLGLFAAVSVGAGVALAKSAKAEPVNADANTWMMRFELCLGSMSPHHNPVPWGDEYVDAIQFHYWGTNVDETINVSHIAYDTHDFYGVNVALNDSQIINGVQWKLHQHGHGDDWKYSVDIDTFGTNDVHALDKDTTLAGIMWQADDLTVPEGWEGDKWNFLVNKGYPTSYMGIEVGINPDLEYINFVKEPSSNSFVIRNHVFKSTDGVSLDAESGGFVMPDGFLWMDEASKQNLQPGAESHTNWWYMNDNGTYDYIISNDGFKIRKHVEDYYAVYLIGVEDDVWVYTFGESGYEQFGEFPGTQLSAIAGKSDVKGDLHFQGSDYGLWTLNVHIGYPKADHIILSYKNEYGVVANQTADMLLVPESAYYFSDVEDYYNDDASAALNFLSYAEEYRLDTADDSICSIDSDDAKAIVNRYNHLTATQRETYVDVTTVNTYKRDGSSGTEYVSYRLVMEQISLIAGIELEGGSGRNISSPIANATSVDSTTLIAVVSIVAFISLSSIGVMLVIKKRKHQ